MIMRPGDDDPDTIDDAITSSRAEWAEMRADMIKTFKGETEIA